MLVGALRRTSSSSSAAFVESYCSTSYDFIHLLQLTSNTANLKRIHAQIIASGLHDNPFLAAKLIALYSDLLVGGRFGFNDARHLFDGLHRRDTLIWNLMIKAASSISRYRTGELSEQQPLEFYIRMRFDGVLRNSFTYAFALNSCSSCGGDGRLGRAVHGDVLRDGFDSDVFVSNALISLYAKCGDLGSARKVFDRIPKKDVVSWNSMIAGYVQNDRARDSIALFHEMRAIGAAGCDLDFITLAAVLSACSAQADLHSGFCAHCYIVKRGIEIDSVVGSSLIGMYSSCGWLASACEAFRETRHRNLIAWNSMIRAFGMHGRGSEAIKTFHEMLESGVEPDGICFLSALSACGHTGMLESGQAIFSMMDEYRVEKSPIHYASMVDLYGRYGRLREAVELVEAMPVELDRDVWGALLGACKVNNALDLAERVAQKLFVLDPKNAGRYAVMVSMYEEMGRREEAAGLRKTMRDRRVRKPLGCSILDVDGEFHTFGVQYESHSRKAEICSVLERLHSLDEVVEEEEEYDEQLLIFCSI